VAVDDAFPGLDLVGAAAGTTVPGSGVIADLVAPGAADADANGVPRSTVDALAAAGLLGDQLTGPQLRETAELLAGTDASTWFCWVQHQTPLRTLAGQAPGQVEPGSAALRADLLPDLRSGRRLAAVAFAHLRRPGPVNPVATRVDGGWVLDGTLDWVTSWDIADVVLVMAADAARDRVVCAYLPAGRGGQTRGLTVGEPLRLLAMAGTHTRPIRLESVRVDDDQVGAVLDLTAWSDADVPARLAARARSLDLAMRAAQSAVVIRAGAAMRAGCSAERRLREAAFLLVQAQTAATRAASLRLLAP
jgi:alkylation response protein AidB-like acyl-CoA dehydrogenase